MRLPFSLELYSALELPPHIPFWPRSLGDGESSEQGENGTAGPVGSGPKITCLVQLAAVETREDLILFNLSKSALCEA